MKRAAPILWALPLTFLLAALAVTAEPEKKKGTSYALLVACQDYKVKDFKPLNYTRDDILEFREALLASGFEEKHVVLMHEKQVDPDLLPEARKIRNQLKLLLAGLQERDTLVVAFSGHGVQDKNDKKSYFCPRDVDLSDRTTLVGFDELFAALKACTAKQKLLLVDACRKETLSDIAKRAEIDVDSVTRPLKESVPEGIVALFSCSPGQESFEPPELKHGVFFYHVLQAWGGEAKALDDKRQLTMGRFTDYVQQQTKEYARLELKAIQVPQVKNEFSDVWVLRTLPTEAPDLEADKFVHFDGKNVWVVLTWYDPEFKKTPFAQVIDGVSGKEISPPLNHDWPVGPAAFSPDGRKLVTCTGTDVGKVRVWDTQSWKQLIPTIELAPNPQQSVPVRVCFSPDSRLIAVASWQDKAARLWDTQTGKPVTPWLKHDEGVFHASFSPDGRSLVTASHDKTARVWDTETGKERLVLKHGREVLAASFSPDGRHVATVVGGGHQVAVIWDARTGKELHMLNPDGGVMALSFSPDGNRVVTTSVDRKAAIWEVKTGKEILTLVNKGVADGPFVSASFSRDGRRLITTGNDKKARVWDAESGKEITPPLNHDEELHNATFSPDGRRVVAVTGGSTARVWDAQSGKELNRVKLKEP